MKYQVSGSLAFHYSYWIAVYHLISAPSLNYSGDGRVWRRCRGVQLILAYSWARPAIFVAGKGRGDFFFLFLHFHSCSSFFPVPLSSLLSLFSLSLGDDTKLPTRVDVSLKSKHNQSSPNYKPPAWPLTVSFARFGPWRAKLSSGFMRTMKGQLSIHAGWPKPPLST